MQASSRPATIVVCADLAAASATRRPLRVEAAAGVPVTWIVPAGRLAALPTPPADVAVALEAGAFASRRGLRSSLAACRAVAPWLDAAVVQGPAPAECRAMLQDEGIRIAVVEALGDPRRAARRPAPAGWRCRNAAWGFWEVEAADPPAGGLLAWLGLVSPGRPRAGSLHVIRVAGDSAGAERRLDRVVAWAQRHVTRGGSRGVSLAGLAGMLVGHTGQPLASSVLHAA